MALLDEHQLSDTVKVAMGTRVDGRVFGKSVGGGDVEFHVTDLATNSKSTN
jgi:hypothetical protein